MEGASLKEVGQLTFTPTIEQLNDFAASQGFEPRTCISERYGYAYYLFCNFGSDRKHIAEQLGWNVDELDGLEATIAEHFWNSLPDQATRFAAEAFCAGRITEEQLLARVDQTWLPRNKLVSPRKRTIRRIDAILKAHDIRPRDLLADDIFCETVYPYFLTGYHIKRERKFIYPVQDELIGRLAAAAPHILAFAPEMPEMPLPPPHPAAGAWRDGERRLLIPFIDRRLATTRIDPATLLAPRALAVYRAMVTTDVRQGAYASQQKQARNVAAAMLSSIVDNIAARVPTETLQLHRLRRVTALTLLGISYEQLPYEYTKGLFDNNMPSTDNLEIPLTSEISVDTTWLSGEMQRVIRGLHGLLEANGRQPEDVLTPSLLTVYQACAELDDAPGELIKHLNRAKTSINSSMRRIIERITVSLSAEVVDLTGRRSRVRAAILEEAKSSKK